MDKRTKRLKSHGFTMIGKIGLDFMLNEVRQAPEGIVMIAGTCHGGDVMAIRKSSPDKHIVVIDSFEGLADPTETDGAEAPPKGTHGPGGLDQYKDNFKIMGSRLPDNIYKMWITEENLKEVTEANIGILILDLDHYAPTLVCLNYFYSRMLPNGRIIVHDYGFFKTKGVKKACEEFAPNKWKQIAGYGKYIGRI